MGDQGAFEQQASEQFGMSAGAWHPAAGGFASNKVAPDHQLVTYGTQLNRAMYPTPHPAQHHYVPYGMQIPGALEYDVDAGYDEMFNDGALGIQMRSAPAPPRNFPKSASEMRAHVDFGAQGMLTGGNYHDGTYHQTAVDDQMLRLMRRPQAGHYNSHLQIGASKQFHQAS